MGKTKKQRFAEHLIAQSRNLTPEIVMKWSNSENLGVQVKSLNSNGDFVIKFSSSDPWIKPSEWLHNYKMAIKQRYEEARSVYQSLFPQEDTYTLSVESQSTKRVEVIPAKYSKLLSDLNVRDVIGTDKFVYPADEQSYRRDVESEIKNVKTPTISILINRSMRRRMNSAVETELIANNIATQVIEANKNS